MLPLILIFPLLPSFPFLPTNFLPGSLHFILSSHKLLVLPIPMHTCKGVKLFQHTTHVIWEEKKWTLSWQHCILSYTEQNKGVPLYVIVDPVYGIGKIMHLKIAVSQLTTQTVLVRSVKLTKRTLPFFSLFPAPFHLFKQSPAPLFSF